jgi:hypothetical protein
MAFTYRSDNGVNNRYVQGGTAESLPTRIGWWERTVYEKSDTDVAIVLQNMHNKRPDIISTLVYGRPTYAWFILQYNNIVDINEEFVAGKTIVLPTRERLMTEILSKST